MAIKQCLKCGHEWKGEGAPPAACPACGAIYARVEEAIRAGQPVRRHATTTGFDNSALPSPVRSAPPLPTRTSVSRLDVHGFVKDMRAQSLYPMWRQLVGFLTMVGYVIAVLVLLGSWFAAWKTGVMGIPIFLGGTALALFIGLMTKVTREGWLMLADLSDAAVRLAAREEV